MEKFDLTKLDSYLRRKQAAEYLGVGVSRLEQLRREGKIEAVKYIYYLYSKEELDRAKAKLTFNRKTPVN